MTTSTLTPYRSGRPPGRDGFAQLLHAEWTKFRTVRGWLIALSAAAVLAILATIAIAGAGNGTQNEGAQNPGATGPNGEAVTDQFEFAHQPLAGNGSLTVAVTALTGKVQAPPGGLAPVLASAVRPGPQPWTKAGIIIKASLKSGSAYAAVMVTGSHGVRMQYDYTHDIAGQGGAPSAAAPAWLRLTRAGDTVTGYDSADGTHWTRIGTATLTGLPSTVQAGMFAASPSVFLSSQGFASNEGAEFSTLGTGTFGHVSDQGNWPASAWSAQPGRRPRIRRAGSCHAGRDADRLVQTPSQAWTPASPAGYLHGGGHRRHRAVRSDSRSARAQLQGHARRPDRGNRARGAVHHRRVPARDDPHDVRREPAPGPGARRQGAGDRDRHVRGRTGRRGRGPGGHRAQTQHDRLGEIRLPGVAAAERARPADGGGNRRAVRAGRDPGGGSRRDVAPQQPARSRPSSASWSSR